MSTRSDRIEARLLPEQRASIDRAAEREGVSRSAFVVGAAIEKAERMLAEETTTRVPASFFDDLLAALDVATPAPILAAAAQQARRDGRLRRT